MKRFSAVAIAALALASPPARATDLFGSAPPMTVPAADAGTAVEVGSNWYIRGDVGIGIENSPTVVPSAGLIPQILTDPGTGVSYVNQPVGDSSHPTPVTRGNNRTAQNGTFDLGVGYRVNDYLRLEASYNFWRGPGLAYSQKSLCPDTTSAVSNTQIVGGAPTPVPIGYAWEPVACNGYLNATQYNHLALASAYIDLGSYWGLTPYIGAGAGLNANTISGSTSFFRTNDGTAFLGNTSASGNAPLQWVTLQCSACGVGGTPVYTPLTTQPQVAFGTQNFNRSFSTTKYSIAGALMAGVGYQLTPSMTVDVGYRYLAPDIFGSVKNSVQQVHVGIRYMAD